MSKTLVIGTVVLVVGIFALGGFFLWQRWIENDSLREQREELGENLEELRSAKSALEVANNALQEEQKIVSVVVESTRARKEEFEQLIGTMTGTASRQNVNLSGTGEKERSIRIIAPNGGENLCIDDDFEIRWEGFNIERVQITLKRAGSGGRIAEFYPATGSYAWKVGHSVGEKLFEPGEGYILSITSYDGGFGIFDESDETFLITRCIG